MFEDQRKKLLDALDETHAKLYQEEEADWPSLYFHRRSLEAARAMNFEPFVEYSYAVLVSWGMQRPGGGGGPKMREFGQYKSSLQAIWPIALQLREKTPDDGLSNGEWDALKQVFDGIDCMVTSPKLVGNSKVMAHLLPELVPPVDGEHTLQFLFRHSQPPDGLKDGWDKLKEILEHFFHPIVRLPSFQVKADDWRAAIDRFRWDTSRLKIADNLVWELSKIKIMENGRKHTVGDPKCWVCKKYSGGAFPQPHRDIVSSCSGWVHGEEFPDASNPKGPKIRRRRCDECQLEVI